MSIRTAREAFINSNARLEFERMAATTAFDVACEYALLAFIEELPADQDPNTLWARDAQRIGAIRVLDILRQIHLKPEEPKEEKIRQLTPPK